MIHRRFFERVRTHDWFAVAVEFVIVAVGVFLGMQVTNWNADRVARRSAESYVERIRADLARNERSLVARIAYYRQVKTHALAALAAFDKPKETLGAAFLVDAFQASQILSPAIDKSTYIELISAGAMNAIPSVAARRRIAGYYQNADAIEAILAYVPPYRETLRRLMPYAVQEAVYAHCDDITAVGAAGEPIPALPDDCKLDLAPGAIRAAVDALLRPDVALDLTRRLADVDIKLKNFQRLIDRARELDQFLTSPRTANEEDAH